MANSERPTAQPPGAATLAFTTDPGTVIVKIPTPPYGATGVVNRAWYEATRIVGRNYTDREIEGGWPTAIEPHRLANLQAPQDSNGQSYIHIALLAACKNGQLRCVAFERVDYGLMPSGNWEPFETWTDFAIAAQDFREWLAAQKMEPSPHIAAWFAAAGVKQADEPCQTAGRVLKKDMHPEWTGQRLAERQAALQGTKAPMKKLAAESGLGDREIRRRITKWSGEKTNPLAAARVGQSMSGKL